MSRVTAIGCALILPLLLAACAHTPLIATVPPPSRDEAIKQLQAVTPCCKTWSELPFQMALPASPHDFTLEPSSPVAELDGQRTHYLTFILPAFHKPYRVLFRAQPSARHLSSSYLLAPTATLLDAQFKPLHSSNDINLCEYIGWRPGLSGAFGSLTVDDSRAKYLVVTTSAAQLKASTYWEQSPTAFSSDASSPAASGSFSIPHGPDGDLSAGILTSSYEGAVDNAICGKPKQGALLK